MFTASEIQQHNHLQNISLFPVNREQTGIIKSKILKNPRVLKQI